MAANQQLKDYIAQQTKLGVSKDAIKSALMSAGWNEPDILQALSETEAVPPEIQPAKPSPMVKPAESSPVSFVTSDIFKPKGDDVFQPKEPIRSAVSESKPEIVSMEEKGKRSLAGKLAKILVGVVFLTLLGGNVYFFLQTRNAGSQVDSLNVTNTGLVAEKDSLSRDKSSLTAEIDSLNKTIAELNNQLSIFAAQPANSSSGIVSFKIKGTISLVKQQYLLTTSQNIILTVKNSTNSSVNAALKLFVGKEAEIAGTHQAGSPQVDVTTINGQSLQEIVNAAATSTAATSTSATSTTQTSTSTTP